MKKNSHFLDNELIESFCANNHLPLDWNESMSLEEYLELLDRKKNK